MFREYMKGSLDDRCLESIEREDDRCLERLKGSMIGV